MYNNIIWWAVARAVCGGSFIGQVDWRLVLTAGRGYWLLEAMGLIDIIDGAQVLGRVSPLALWVGFTHEQ